MTLKKWTSGDTITERSANNKGIRKGTTTDRNCIAGADKELGDAFFNETNSCLTILIDQVADEWENVREHISADSSEVCVTGTTATQRKAASFVKSTGNGYAGNRLFIVAEIKTSNGGSTASFRTRLNGSCCDSLVLTTTCTSYEVKTGSIDISAVCNCTRNTLEFFLDDGGCADTITNRELEVWGV